MLLVVRGVLLVVRGVLFVVRGVLLEAGVVCGVMFAPHGVLFVELRGKLDIPVLVRVSLDCSPD